VTAAVAGSVRQPSTNSSTSRNSAAVRAADTNANAALGATAGRRELTTGAGTNARPAINAAGIAAAVSGIWTTKIDCQETVWVSNPPSTGPAAVPTTPDTVHSRTPRRSPVTATNNSRQPTNTS